jgi:hypothetical protein
MAGHSAKDPQTGPEQSRERGEETSTADDPGYAQGEFGVKPADASPDRAAAVERAASKPVAAPEEIALPESPEGDDPGVNPKPGSGG